MTQDTPGKLNGQLRFCLSAIGFLSSAATQAWVLFLPLHAQELGASDLLVGLIIASYGVTFFFSSLVFGRQADLHGRLKFIRVGLALAIPAYAAELLAASPPALMVVMGVIGAAMGMASAALMAYVHDMEGAIGKFSSYSSLGWFFSSVAGAILLSNQALFLLASFLSLVALALTIPLGERAGRVAPMSVLSMDVFRQNWLVYVPMVLRQVGAQSVWTIYPLFLASIGADKFWIAVISGINNGTQVLTMRLADRIQPSKAVAIGLICSSLFFAYHGLATQYWQVLPIQVVLAVAWAGLWVGASNLLLQAGTEKATSMGILYSSNSFSQVLGPLVGGNVSQAFGFRPLMFLASGMALAGLGLRWRLKGRVETAWSRR